MRISRLMLVSAVGVGAAGVGVYGQQLPPAPPAPPAQVTPATAPGDAGMIQAIREAADPSAAVQAYTAAVAHGGADVAVEDAYVRRMVSFNLPDMAEAQAQDVLKREPDNQVARAVVAYMQGRRGQAVDALRTIVQAAGGSQAVTDPFVLRTAGQLVAWYDTRADKGQIAQQLRTDVEAMRRKLSAQDEYGLAYGSARDAYQGRSSTEQGAAQQQQQVPAYDQSGQPMATVPVEPAPEVGAYDDSYAYPYTYGYTGTYYPYNYWPRDHRWPGYHVYEPAYVPPVIIPRQRHHDHDHDWDHGRDGNDGHHRDGDHDRDGDHGHDHDGHDGDHGHSGGAAAHTHPYDDMHWSRNRAEPSVLVPRPIEPTTPRVRGGTSSGSTGRAHGQEPPADLTPRRSAGGDGGMSRDVDSPPSPRVERRSEAAPSPAPRPQPSRAADQDSSGGGAGARQSRSTSPGGDARRSR